MKRRGFLGLMGGAVVAGPSAATRAVSGLPKGLGVGINAVSQSADFDCSPCSPDNDWRPDRIKKIKRLLTGIKTDEEKEQERRERLYGLRVAAEVRVANLRSISDGAKIRMAQREVQKIEDERSRSYLADELNRLLKGE